VQPRLGLPDIGPPAREVGRQADRYDRRWLLLRRQRRFQLALERARLQGHQLAEFVDVLADLAIEAGKLGLGAGGLRGRTDHVDVAAQTRSPAQAGEIQQVTHGGDGLLNDPTLGLGAAQVKIGAADLAQGGHQNRAAVLDRGLSVGLGGFHRAPHAAEQVDLPGGVEA